MARIPDLRTIKTEDFDKKDQGMVDKIAFPFNNFMQQVIGVFKNGIDYNNLNRQVVTVTVSVDSTGTPIGTIQFRNNLATKIQGIICMRALNQSPNIRYPASQPFISWSENNSVITIVNISGIGIPEGQTNSDIYQLTLELIGQNLPTA